MTNCVTRLETPEGMRWICHNCGALMRREEKFCGGCGCEFDRRVFTGDDGITYSIEQRGDYICVGASITVEARVPVPSDVFDKVQEQANEEARRLLSREMERTAGRIGHD